MEEQGAWMAAVAKGTAVLVPGESVTLTYSTGVTVPLTGVCQTDCNYYGPDAQSRVPVVAGRAVTVPLR